MSESNLLDQIAKLRGSINTYKTSAQNTDSNQPYPTSNSSTLRGRGRGTFRGRVRSRGRGRGCGRFAGPIRNRTLIVNNKESENTEFISTISSNGYKLINKKVYEDELKKDVLTKEEKIIALQQAKQKIILKRAELRASKNRVKLDLCDRSLIDGKIYSISRFGARLVPLEPVVSSIGQDVHWNGYDYTRIKNGILKLVGEKVFLKEQCRYFQKSGECQRGDSCKYTHNKSKVAICRKYIKGQCTDDSCKLSHELNEFNTPICHFFASGSCRNPECSFLHVHPELELICRPFAIGNYCFRGKACKFIHAFECPDYQIKRECPRGKNCRLTHSEKDNIDARLTFNSLSPEYYQLPDLTRLDHISSDPRILHEDIEDNAERLIFSDEEEDDDDDETFDSKFYEDHPELQQLEVSADFVEL